MPFYTSANGNTTKIGGRGRLFAGSAISVAKKSVCSSCQSDRLILSPGPRRGRELLNLGDFRGGQAGEQVLQIIERIDSLPPTTAQQSVNHCTTFPSFGMPEK